MILFEAVKLFLGDVYGRLGKNGGLTMENSANKMEISAHLTSFNNQKHGKPWVVVGVSTSNQLSFKGYVVM